MNVNKQTRRSYVDDPLPAGTIIHLRGMFPELASVSPGRISPADLPAEELEGERRAEATESAPNAPESGEHGGSTEVTTSKFSIAGSKAE